MSKVFLDVATTESQLPGEARGRSGFRGEQGNEVSAISHTVAYSSPAASSSSSLAPDAVDGQHPRCSLMRLLLPIRRHADHRQGSAA